MELCESHIYLNDYLAKQWADARDHTYWGVGIRMHVSNAKQTALYDGVIYDKRDNILLICSSSIIYPKNSVPCRVYAKWYQNRPDIIYYGQAPIHKTPSAWSMCSILNAQFTITSYPLNRS